MVEYSVSASRGDIAPKHDSREYTPANVEPSLTARNEVIKACPDVAAAVNEFFRPAIDRYNAKQIAAKRPDRQKKYDYYERLLSGEEGYGSGRMQEKPVYEYVLQIGNKDTNGVTDDSFDEEHWQALKKAGKADDAAKYVKAHLNNSPDREALKETLTDVGKKLQDKYPNFHMLYCYGHDDEPCGTYQLHVAFVPFVGGQKTGLDTRVSLRKALKEMGFTGNPEQGIKAWQRDVKEMIADEMAGRGYQRADMGNDNPHLSVDAFKDQQKQLAALNAEIAAKQQLLSDYDDAINERKVIYKAEDDRLSDLESRRKDLMQPVPVTPPKGITDTDRAVLDELHRRHPKGKDGKLDKSQTMYDVYNELAHKRAQADRQQETTRQQQEAVAIQQAAQKPIRKPKRIIPDTSDIEGQNSTRNDMEKN